jgi:hypothetical protein
MLALPSLFSDHQAAVSAAIFKVPAPVFFVKLVTLEYAFRSRYSCISLHLATRHLILLCK